MFGQLRKLMWIVEETVEALKDGKVMAVPTDTLYGFACDACTMEAVNRTYTQALLQYVLGTYQILNDLL